MFSIVKVYLAAKQNTKFFLLDEGISNEMANFLTMALDPHAGNIFQLMNHQIPNYQEKILDLEDELDEILQTRNISILQLFQRVAIR